MRQCFEARRKESAQFDEQPVEACEMPLLSLKPMQSPRIKNFSAWVKPAVIFTPCENKVL